MDLSRFENGNFVLPGLYSVDVYVNENLATSVQIR
ncbi:FimD/PapC N-terminal domain-containing protein [Burkholderia sp. MSMB0856]|nr:FimD/PapC N-terminal domain-containing protein [Burkholderia sp. MSMB0856]